MVVGNGKWILICTAIETDLEALSCYKGIETSVSLLFFVVLSYHGFVNNSKVGSGLIKLISPFDLYRFPLLLSPLSLFGSEPSLLTAIGASHLCWLRFFPVV
ncbi:hypothetical protein FCM35_KLT13210 [Carex littledalei]|uniref:Uncharacterized protein n=1 Tax=Carex littledalei TaxID=544730 RepID=A0A833QNP0_9POAL|nr:hypothetical protein FCM35_KLT13210 [Carex littledalei]